jgi:hypothetical protein
VSQKPKFRYRTEGGATVEVTAVEVTDPGDHRAACTGCDATWSLDSASDWSLEQVKSWAQTHSEKCRALPHD